MQHKNSFPVQPNPAAFEKSPANAQYELLAESMAAQPGYVTEAIGVEPTNFIPEKAMVPGATNEHRAVEQDLYGVVHAGGDLFGIVRVRAQDQATGKEADGFILTHIDKNGNRAQVVGGFKEGEPLSVGRHHQDYLDTETSRDHFKIGMRDGKIVIGEDGKPSANGTELIRPRREDEIKAPQDVRRFGFKAFKKRFASKHAAKEGAIDENANLLADFNVWSAKSSEAKEELFSMFTVGGGRYIDTAHEKPAPKQESNRFFASKYELPKDQFAAESQLRDTFAKQFPDELPVLNEALSDVQRMIGIGVPKYSIVAEQKTDAQAAGMADEMGFLPSSDPNGVVFSSMLLQMPKEYSSEQIVAMTEAEKLLAAGTESGMTIVGELPDSTKALVEGLYALTGAEIVRDGRAEGDDPGEIIRKGMYQGEEVYFAEGYHDTTSYYDEPMFSLHMLGPRFAQQALEAPNKAQIREFIALSGVAPTDVIKTFVSHKVTKHNYKEIAQVLGETRKIIDGE